MKCSALFRVMLLGLNSKDAGYPYPSSIIGYVETAGNLYLQGL